MELHNLIKSSNIEEIEKYLIKNPEAINKVYSEKYYNDQTPLLCAVEYSNAKTVKLLLNYGANANMYVPTRNYPIVRSVTSACDNLEKLKLLLDYGANFYLKDDYDMNIIYYAVYWKFRKTTRILLEYDAHYDGKDIEPTTLVEKIKLLNIKN